MIRALFFGTPLFSCPALKALLDDPQIEVVGVVTQPDRPKSRGLELVPSELKLLALESSVPLFQPISLKKELSSFIDQFLALGPIDIGVVVAFGQILPTEILNLPRIGCINIHGSLLPRWRGAAPIQRAVMNGDSKTGVGLMQMEAGLDTGPVFCQAEVEISEADTAGDLYSRLSELGAELLSKNILRIVNGELKPTPQAETGITYASKITADEALLDLSLDARAVAQKIRGLSPFPGAFVFLGDKRLKIFNALAKSEIPSERLSVGEIAFSDSRTIEVACGKGTISLLEVQLEGKKRLKIDQFMRGNPSLGTLRGAHTTT